ncbi:MAG: 2-hydroxychromene-2-carboxylate isomerase [Gammaproteobacteria bacterium HGW-Gammaproteobacteria-14]|nr:MAG: 2-hydroxychromene-2-carboxylate isomerase [Gammaproteobacteria bacterium HGW-Gammaproteobacteria-14]
MPYVAQLLTSQRLRRLHERWFAMRRRIQGKPQEAVFYFRVDDPYSWLLAQQLSTLSRDTGLRIRPRTMLHLPKEMYPEPELHRQYSIQDAALAAQLHNLQFTAGPAPSHSDAFAASRILLAHENDPGYLSLAQTLSRHLWSGDIDAIHVLGTHTDVMPEKQARQQLEARRDSFLSEGHYLTGTLQYGGSWYWGPDRIDHLYERLAAERHEPLALQKLAWRQLQLRRPPRATQRETLEFFFSFRSPYSYLALERVLALTKHYQLDLQIRPVLPMVMRGLSVPKAKRFYILRDAAREARRADVPFGKICDPVGPGVERCMAIWPLAERDKKLVRFISEATRAIWSEGVDVATDAGLKRVVERAGLDWVAAKTALGNNNWVAAATKNRDDMVAAGSWGVPTFRLRDITVWGQDRLPVIEKLLLEEIRS